MQRLFIKLFALFFCLTSLAVAQAVWLPATGSDSKGLPPLFATSSSAASYAGNDPVTAITLAVPVALPRMAPELALQVFRGRAVVQSAQLTSYSATTVIRAELPDTQQYGEYELQRQYSAPRTLAFKAVRFTGDNFVKTNVILRLLQSEVSHVEKDDPSLNAVTPENYKFSYKGTHELNGRVVHLYHVKPRHKRAGLFKGHIYLDAYSGSIVRAEGRLVKSPSLFIKKVEFVQDYADIESFTFPVHIHSEAQTRLVGRAVVDIYQRDYQPVAVSTTAQPMPAL